MKSSLWHNGNESSGFSIHMHFMTQIPFLYFLNYSQASKEAAAVWQGGAVSHCVRAFKCYISPPCWKQWQQIIIVPKRWQPTSYNPGEKWLSQPSVGTGERLKSKPPNRPLIVLYLVQHELSSSACYTSEWSRRRKSIRKQIPKCNLPYGQCAFPDSSSYSALLPSGS